MGISVLTQKTADVASLRREARVLTLCVRHYGTVKAGRDLVSDRRLGQSEWNQSSGISELSQRWGKKSGVCPVLRVAVRFFPPPCPLWTSSFQKVHVLHSESFSSLRGRSGPSRTRLGQPPVRSFYLTPHKRLSSFETRQLHCPRKPPLLEQPNEARIVNIFSFPQTIKNLKVLIEF